MTETHQKENEDRVPSESQGIDQRVGQDVGQGIGQGIGQGVGQGVGHLAIAALLILALVPWIAWAPKAANWEDHLVLADDFSRSAPIRGFMEVADGERGPGGGLLVRAGETAKRVYRFSRLDHQKLSVRIGVDARPADKVEFEVLFGNAGVKIDPRRWDGEPIDLTELTEAGNSRFELRVTNGDPLGAPPREIVKRFEFTRVGEAPPLHRSAYIFYGVAGGFAWIATALFALGLWKRFSDDRRVLSQRGRVAFLVGAVVLFAAFIMHSRNDQWSAKKDYDDRAAIGNAALLLDSGFDPETVYFRSRVRPGFPAFVQPILAFVPHALSSFWLNPSDGYRQFWLIYDQDNATFGLFTFPALTLMAQAMALALVLGIYAIFRELDVEPLPAGIGALLSLFFFDRSLTVAITQTFNLFVNVMAVWFFLRAWKTQKLNRLFGTGLVLGFAGIVKETAVTTVIAVGLFMIFDGPAKEVGKRIGRGVGMAAGSAFWLVWYYALVADGGFGAISENWLNHLAQQEANLFEPLTFSTGLSDMQIVFSALGLGMAAVGLAVRLGFRLPGKADRFMLFWTIGCLPVFTLPYIFPRFLKYLIPSTAYWVVMCGVSIIGLFARSKTPKNGPGGKIAPRPQG